MKRQIYCDHNATTPLHPYVQKKLTAALNIFGNPSSLHSYGRSARQAVEQSRQIIADFINASPEEIIFVGSGSEANNSVLGLLTCSSQHCSCHRDDRNELITTSIEHPCILETSKCLKDKGTTVHYLSVDTHGKINAHHLEKSLSDTTALVSVMMANNEIGTIQDVKALAVLAHKHGALFHTDAVQAVGKISIDVRDLDVDFLTISAHKMYGPKGIGALYARKGIPFCPFIRGGHQEKGRRAGTENTLGIIGFGAAVQMRKKEMREEAHRLRGLRSALKKGIADMIPDCSFNGHPTDVLPGTLNVSFDGAEGEAILLYLDLAGIAVSTGSACASGSLDPSHVLLATGIPVERAHGSIRISLGRDNTGSDIQYILKTLPPVIQKIRAMSSGYNRGTRHE